MLIINAPAMDTKYKVHAYASANGKISISDNFVTFTTKPETPTNSLAGYWNIRWYYNNISSEYRTRFYIGAIWFEMNGKNVVIDMHFMDHLDVPFNEKYSGTVNDAQNYISGTVSYTYPFPNGPTTTHRFEMWKVE